jgi:hypothetical protein
MLYVHPITELSDHPSREKENRVKDTMDKSVFPFYFQYRVSFNDSVPSRDRRISSRGSVESSLLMMGTVLMMMGPESGTLCLMKALRLSRSGSLTSI